jgi:CubicO group peptidase (beta-lactamase class C family)
MTLLAWVLLAQTIPGAAWEERAPEAVGLSKDKLDALRDLAGGRGCVVRKGVLAYAWGDVAKSADVGAAAQPLIGTLLMMAVDEGKLSGVDARISEVDPRLTGKDAGITWRQLAHPVSGGGLGIFSGMLMGKVFRQTESEALKQRLGDVLRFQDRDTAEASGLAISPRDFARYGLLILRGGTWGARQVVSAPLTYLSISSPAPGPGCRSFGWWLNGIDDQRRQLFVDGPGDLVAALGDRGKCALWILPSLDLIVSWNDARIDDLDRSPGNPDAAVNRSVRRMVESILR